ncbi:MAG: hypothetical protein A3D87_07945 [Omnitrophica WOR_2 bacterium RIFCSPHIGHO2_02_FULL_50_17]|nr:MAG: hypothetical protein A3D87_07945 [Omnitrophica WOR_2 bacterium RIFCSPHIGHO2_02_FULL_50_17]
MKMRRILLSGVVLFFSCQFAWADPNPSGDQKQPERSVTKLDNQSIEEFLAAHPPENLRNTPQAAPEGKKEVFRLRWQDGLVAGVAALLIALIAIYNKNKASAKREKKEREESVQKSMGLSEGEKKVIQESESAPPTAINEKNYWRYVPGVLLYPLKGQVVFATIGGAIFFAAMNVAMYAPFYGLIVLIMFFCYWVGCMVSIIETAVSVEREDAFDWPDFMAWFDWIGKAVLMVLSWVLCYGPAAAYYFYFKRYDLIFFALVVIGGFIAPMYTLAVSLVGGLSSLNIVNIFKSIGCTFVPYVLTLIFLVLTQALNLLVNRIPLVFIPIWGGLFKWLIFVYFLFVNMRLLGLFYKAHRLKLRWYGEDENDA